MRKVKHYTAYLFDMDGTLVASEKLKGQALAKTCLLFGGKVSVDVYKDVMGQSWEQVCTHFFRNAEIDPGIKEFSSAFRPVYKELLLSELETNPNVVDLLLTLKKNGKKTGVVSSAYFWMVEQVLTQLELIELFDIVVTEENVMQHKPHPEAYLLALEKLALPASEVLIFEDSESGLTAASEAGCDVVAFQHEFNRNHDFSLANDVITNFNQFEKR
ncbi:HAD family phosphatase [Prolixibacteraceae bacterium Z1-6]|uniref:HAD family phosphatase n=1 Tax=Draconibacterium aestuarii TaxID=2998507 RepID=A0A9X3FI87_9BACT|nr:HAD family phosphatase [Prolixibacteraceae bacterium Z1-6]